MKTQWRTGIIASNWIEHWTRYYFESGTVRNKATRVKIRITTIVCSRPKNKNTSCVVSTVGFFLKFRDFTYFIISFSFYLSGTFHVGTWNRRIRIISGTRYTAAAAARGGEANRYTQSNKTVSRFNCRRVFLRVSGIKLQSHLEETRMRSDNLKIRNRTRDELLRPIATGRLDNAVAELCPAL